MKRIEIGDQVETRKGRTEKRKGWRITVTEIQARIDGDHDLTGFTRGGASGGWRSGV